MFLKVALAAAALVLPLRDTGGFDDVTPGQRAWFQRDRIRACCSEADGQKVVWRGDESAGFEVAINGNWVKVPPQTVIRDQGNPFLEGLVWLYPYTSRVDATVRCFIPGGGT